MIKVYNVSQLCEYLESKGTVRIEFGKYEGFTLADVKKKDMGYLAWCWESVNKDKTDGKNKNK